MNKKGSTLSTLFFVLFIGVLILIGPIGYVKNIFALSRCDFKSPYKAEVIRLIGVFTPISIITGYMDIKDK